MEYTAITMKIRHSSVVTVLDMLVPAAGTEKPKTAIGLDKRGLGPSLSRFMLGLIYPEI